VERRPHSQALARRLGADVRFADTLDVPCLVVPYANADENNHAPDENIALACFRAGARTTVALLEELSDADLE